MEEALAAPLAGPRRVYVGHDSADDAARTLVHRLCSEAAAAGWRVLDNAAASVDLAIAVGTAAEDVEQFAGHAMTGAIVTRYDDEWVRSGALDAAHLVVAVTPLVQAQIDVGWGRGIAELLPELADPSRSLFDALVGRLAPAPDRLRIGVSTCAPDWEVAQFWGDTYLAKALMRAFRRLGQETVELPMSHWQGERAARCDVVVHLRGTERRPVQPGQRNVLWVISHPDRVTPEECADYDVIASASPIHTTALGEQLRRPVQHLPQATDADTFRPGPRDPDYEAPVLYVGIARWPPRRAPRWMLRNGRAFDLYGRFWVKQPEGRYLREEHLDNRDLTVAYRSADVVVADHHGSMRREGFAANRLFDVLASGGVVLSDDVVGLDDIFGSTVPTYSNPAELEAQIVTLLSDPALRRRLSAEGRALVTAGHTIDHRAEELLRLLAEA